MPMSVAFSRLADLKLVFDSCAHQPGGQYMVWVGVNGSDNNNCESGQHAGKTISNAIFLTAPGDSIFVAPATYHEGLFIPFNLKTVGCGATTTIVDVSGLNSQVAVVASESKERKGIAAFEAATSDSSQSILGLQGMIVDEIEDSFSSPVRQSSGPDQHHDSGTRTETGLRRMIVKRIVKSQRAMPPAGRKLSAARRAHRKCYANIHQATVRAAAPSSTTEPLVTSFVECPYCDGENIVDKIGSNRDRGKLHDREIACRHCQCLFLMSESPRGIQKKQRATSPR